MLWKSDDTILLHNFVRQKESIVACLHVVCWYIGFQDDNRNNLLIRWTSNCLDHHFGSWNFYQGTSYVQSIWTPKQGRQLDVLMESDNRMDKFAVCVKINEKIVRHLRKGTSRRFAKTIFYFLRNNAYSSAWAKVTGKRCNLGDGEVMQARCKLSLSGQPKFVSLLRIELMKMKVI